MTVDDKQSIDLATAQDAIVKACTVLPGVELPLGEALGRVAAKDHTALEALPGYDGSLRDGYAVGSVSENNDSTRAVFQIVDEVAAGDTRTLSLQPGECIRIMTGGLIPTGCQAVIPQENCRVEENTIVIPLSPLQIPKTFIHRKGSEVAEGQIILRKGEQVSSDHQVLLAGCGYGSVAVCAKPKVSFFCTGSELLTDAGSNKLAGQRFSGNSYLLSGMIPKFGGELLAQTTVVDDVAQVIALMQNMAKDECNILISTGGMGPGKFDLIEEAFDRCNGKTIYRSLNMRPGKATLFGTLGSTLFFGLPGPPPAVQLLFHELIRPALCALQGDKQCKPQDIRATLTEDLSTVKHGLLRLKNGVFSLRNGQCLVRPAGREETANCYIFCSPGQEMMQKGALVSVHLTVSCLDSVLSS